ncbi:hypothetical protein GGR08_000580 [Bartonella fuyuanensis]|uniref:Uncharacterized protein n=1 Tax=Bartonella fuyuanensis TaxID=1460968 RepID=A0A840E064_9HYPH|nr:hypothetical protein [Bartonella fuyuanensis]MBB4076287.1 hypothetical protein [Bartonella fuyuanensis]
MKLPSLRTGGGSKAKFTIQWGLLMDWCWLKTSFFKGGGDVNLTIDKKMGVIGRIWISFVEERW